MSTETGISTFQIDNLAVAILGRRATYEELLFARAIEIAVLQSPEIRALRKDAERYRWLLGECYRWPKNGGLCNEYDQTEPVALWVKREVGDDPCAAIDAAMENQP